MQDIRLQKGTFDIKIFTSEVTEGGDNTLTVVNIPTTKKNQADGQKDTKVVDLLRIKNTFHIEGYIASDGINNARQIKESLKSLFKGGGESTGNPINLIYDGLTFQTYPEKWVLIKLHTPENLNDTNEQWAFYRVTLDLVEGIPA